MLHAPCSVKIVSCAHCKLKFKILNIAQHYTQSCVDGGSLDKVSNVNTYLVSRKSTAGTFVVTRERPRTLAK